MQKNRGTLKLLLDELNHRVKNSLAIVPAIAMQPRRNAPTPKAFTEALDARIPALAKAHDRLTRAVWEGGRAGNLLNLTLNPTPPKAQSLFA